MALWSWFLLHVLLYPLCAGATGYNENCIFEVFSECKRCSFDYGADRYYCLKKCLNILNKDMDGPCNNFYENKYVYDAFDTYNSNLQQETALRTLAKHCGLYFGMALNYGKLHDQKYMNIASKQFSSITAENACKWSYLQPKKDFRNYEACDKIIRESVKHDQVVRGHALSWARSTQNPKWFTEGNFTKEETIGILKDHIDDVLRYYGTNVYVWDVVNEPISDTNNKVLKVGHWYPKIKNYIDIAFIQAAKSRKHPNIKLFINDYNVASSRGYTAKKAQKLYDLVVDMKQRGIPIDGVGFQLHVDINYSLVDGVKANIERFGNIGVDVHMTEIDVGCAPRESKCASGWGEKQEQMQAEVYAALMRVCLDTDACKSYTIWGAVDKYTWIQAGHNPLLYDKKYQPKLAVKALMDTLSDNNVWVNRYYQRINRKPVADVLDEISSSPWNDFHGVEQHENIFGMEDEL